MVPDLLPPTQATFMSKPSFTDTKSIDSRSNASSTPSDFKDRRSRKSSQGSFDPLAKALAPPPDETPEDRALRQKAEEKAKKLSEDIDKYLKQDGEENAKKRKATVRLLLLGQSESGKSTALKNFQLLYNPQSFQAERLAWRLVILFNLVHSIRILHHIVSEALTKQQQDEEEADSRDVSLGKSPTSPLFSRSPLPDFQDLLPPMPERTPSHKPTSRSHHNGLSLSFNFSNVPGSPPLSPIGTELDPDLTDAASSHSAGSTSNAPKSSAGRRGSFFSASMLDKKRPGERKRPSTSTGVSPITPASAFSIPASPPTSKKSPVVAKLRTGALSDDEYRRTDIFNLHRSRSRDSLLTKNNTLRPNGRLMPEGLESNTSLAAPREPAPKAFQVAPNPIPQPQSYPDLRWGAQHTLLLMRLKPLLTIEVDLLRRLSVPDEEEAVRLDFNLPEMHNAAVRVAISGGKSSAKDDSDESSLGKRNSGDNGIGMRFSRSISGPGRPRARSSVDIDIAKNVKDAIGKDAIKVNSAGSNSTSSLDVELSPSIDRRKSEDILSRMRDANLNSKSNGAAPGYGLASNISTKARVLIPSGDGVVIPEFFVRSTINWKEKLRKISKYDPTDQYTKAGKIDGQSWEWNPWDDEMDPAHFIHACARDVKALWNDPIVQEYLDRNKYKMEHSPGFFLSDVERITAREYIPTDDDILRARIKTIGVTEHKLTIDSRGTVPKEWLVYDVGGARTQRAAWLPYFDTTDAIIFIASLSSFDQVLTEDQSVNRMEDSLRLFRTIVSSAILKDVNIILLLNKMDLLDAKIQAGVQVNQHFKRYGDRANTTEAVTKYFRTKFTAIFEKFTPPHSPRILSIHTTSLTNPKSTRIILEAVSESIIKAHMRKQGVV